MSVHQKFRAQRKRQDSQLATSQLKDKADDLQEIIDVLDWYCYEDDLFPFEDLRRDVAINGTNPDTHESFKTLEEYNTYIESLRPFDYAERWAVEEVQNRFIEVQRAPFGRIGIDYLKYA